MAIETLKYEVIKKNKNIEIRKYPEYIQAEVEVEDVDYRSAIGKGFQILAGYIFGDNRSQKKINMTSPVKTSRSEKIAMTTPVKISGENTFDIAFVMPSIYTLNTLPVSNDKRIKIRKIKPEKLAVIRFSGFFNQKKIDNSLILIKEYLKNKNIKTAKKVIIAGYNPPWIPGFLARNEVMIKVK
jgi:hypothetical protein